MKKPYVAIVDDDSAFAELPADVPFAARLRGAVLHARRRAARVDEAGRAARRRAARRDDARAGRPRDAARAEGGAARSCRSSCCRAANQASTIVEAVRLGAADYVVKPDDPEGLGEIALDVAIKNAIEKTRLVSELTELRQQLSDDEDRAVWGNSEKMRGIATVIEQVADSDVTVLIRGESGVGKELVARAIHQRSTRTRPAVRQGQLRGAAGRAARERAVRPREGRLHRRGDDAHRQVRAGRHRHDDARRDRRDEAGAAGQAAARAAGRASSPSSAATSAIKVDVRVVAATNRDLETDDAERRVPRGPLLPAEGHRADGAAAARAARRDPDADRLLHRPLLAQVQPAGAAALGGAAPAVPDRTSGPATSASSRT